jgi:uncharacterized metal-binding protein/rhodanese-related sulfurtransferase
MNCIGCKTKLCKSEGKDCTGVRDEMLRSYEPEEVNSIYRNADELVSGGRAGRFSRLEELARFCRLQGYERVGMVYCYGIEDLAGEAADFLSARGVKVLSYRCTLGGVRENMIGEGMGNSVNCNPAGQALAVKRDHVDFVVEMGLCLGHDVILHRMLEVPHTVFMVKDRVHNHNPARALPGYRDANDEFIESLDASYNMRSPAWLKEKIGSGEGLVILDLRTPDSFLGGHIDGSVNIPLKELPARYTLLEEHRNDDIVCVCGGSVQSAYAIGYLYSRGFKKVHNLSGGFSRYKNEIGEGMVASDSLLKR